VRCGGSSPLFGTNNKNRALTILLNSLKPFFLFGSLLWSTLFGFHRNCGKIILSLFLSSLVITLVISRKSDTFSDSSTELPIKHFTSWVACYAHDHRSVINVHTTGHLQSITLPRILSNQNIEIFYYCFHFKKNSNDNTVLAIGTQDYDFL